jgi:hypothetical protein
LSANIHLNVLNNNYDRMRLFVSTFSGDCHLMADSPRAIAAGRGEADVAQALQRLVAVEVEDTAIHQLAVAAPPAAGPALGRRGGRA